MNLHIVALFRFRENSLIDAIEMLKILVNKTRMEEGCLQYDLIEDSTQKGVFFIVEIWQSEEHHFKHSVSEHLQHFRTNSVPIMEESAVVYKGFKIF